MTEIDKRLPLVPVLDVGGTHVTAATVDPRAWTLASTPVRVDVDAQADAAAILDGLAATGRSLAGAHDTRWAVAMPDPFDYERGVGRFHGVAKFESLDGVDVRAELLARLPGATDVVFCNDADAFTVGEWVAGAARGATHVVGLTLGTGVGSGWVVDGRIVDPGTPPGGRAHLLRIDGLALEEAMSRRAVLRGWVEATGDRSRDVREIADLARTGDAAAIEVLATALRSLGRALARPISEFGADVIVVGGSMSRSWSLFEPWFREGAGDVVMPEVRVARDADAAPLVGAAYVAVSSSRSGSAGGRPGAASA